MAGVAVNHPGLNPRAGMPAETAAGCRNRIAERRCKHRARAAGFRSDHCSSVAATELEAFPAFAATEDAVIGPEADSSAVLALCLPAASTLSLRPRLRRPPPRSGERRPPQQGWELRPPRRRRMGFGLNAQSLRRPSPRATQTWPRGAGADERTVDGERVGMRPSESERHL